MRSARRGVRIKPARAVAFALAACCLFLPLAPPSIVAAEEGGTSLASSSEEEGGTSAGSTSAGASAEEGGTSGGTSGEGTSVEERGGTAGCAPSGAAAGEPASHQLTVTNVEDEGPGSLRQAILAAAALAGPVVIKLDGAVFAEPRTLHLTSELPALTGCLTIDGYVEDRLWAASGLTVSGGSRHRVFRTAPGSDVTLRHLSVEAGSAPVGGGLLNRGRLRLHGVTFVENRAARRGGALANESGTVVAVNSTFHRNRAGSAGGGLATRGGRATLVNCTFYQNTAESGSGVHSTGELLLSNSIVAGGTGGEDCVARRIDAASTNNLIGRGRGCGTPIETADPRLEPLGYYNGPTRTLPLASASPAINRGDNASALDERGAPLRWDQRGNGDPRFVGGLTDIGAFEHQILPRLVVDTLDDTERRGCLPAQRRDCPLRAAIALANAAGEPVVVSFDAEVFAGRRLELARPLPAITGDVTLDASGFGEPGEPLVVGDGLHGIDVAPEGKLVLVDVRIGPAAATRRAGGDEAGEPPG